MTMNYTIFSAILLFAGNIGAMNNNNDLNNAPYAVKGLKNIGSTCFINAALQVAYAMTDITYGIDTLDEKFYKDGSLAAEYTDLVKQIKKNGLNAAISTRFVQAVQNHLKIPAGKQGDADEVFVALLQSLTYNNHVERLYTVSLISTRYNIPLNYVSEPQHEKAVSLGLMVTADTHTLTQCLSNYFKPTGELCSIGDNKVDCEQRRFLEKSENYFVISLSRRFHSMDNKGNISYHKQNNPISFPLKGLTLENYAESAKDAKGPYELIGIIMHSGSANSGHFTSYVKAGNQWHFCDDSKITKLNESDLSAVAAQGYGRHNTMVATCLVYELSSARPEHPPATLIKQNSYKATPSLSYKKPLFKTTTAVRGRRKPMTRATVPRKSIYIKKR